MKIGVPPKTRRQARADRQEERIRQKREEPAPAAVALIQAQEWQTLLDDEGINRAEIARRYGLSRARVSQVMSLMNLDPDEAIDKGDVMAR